MAITSAKKVFELGAIGRKKPFLTFYPDLVVLIPMLDSNPKVTSVFHDNQEIVLPIFKMAESERAHPLDVCKTLQVYLWATASFKL